MFSFGVFCDNLSEMALNAINSVSMLVVFSFDSQMALDDAVGSGYWVSIVVRGNTIQNICPTIFGHVCFIRITIYELNLSLSNMCML